MTTQTHSSVSSIQLKNIIVLGSGRSGTSMLMGTLQNLGYSMGRNLYESSVSNPKGYFESWDINGINEEIIAENIPSRPRWIGDWLFRHRPELGQRWLAQIPLKQTLCCSAELQNKIKRVTANQPFCFKDTRFSYTLPLWRPFLGEAKFICVFRDPATTVTSILKDCRDSAYLQTLRVTPKDAFKVWALTYQHILKNHRHEGDWLFIHYDQMLTQEGITRLELFLGHSVQHDFVDHKLKRSKPIHKVPANAVILYNELCHLSNYSASSITEELISS